MSSLPGFIGSPAMNLLPARVTEGGVVLGDAVVAAERSALGNAATEVTIGLRPEDIQVHGPDGTGLQVTVNLVEELGADGYIYAEGEQGGRREQVVARVSGGEYPRVGEQVKLSVKPGRVHLFDVETGERLNGPVGLPPKGRQHEAHVT